MPYGLVGYCKFTYVMTDHLGLDRQSDEVFPVVNMNGSADHFGQDNHVAHMIFTVVSLPFLSLLERHASFKQKALFRTKHAASFCVALTEADL
jgi:hypothetical protein